MFAILSFYAALTAGVYVLMAVGPSSFLMPSALAWALVAIRKVRTLAYSCCDRPAASNRGQSRSPARGAGARVRLQQHGAPVLQGHPARARTSVGLILAAPCRMSALAGAAPPVGARGAEGPPPFRRRHSGPVALGPRRRRPSRRRRGARPGWCHRIHGHLPSPELNPTAVQHAGALSTPAHAKRAFALVL